MSDSTSDAALAASYDAATAGQSVIDTGGTIQPDDRPRPAGDDRPVQDLGGETAAEHAARDVETTRELGNIYDLVSAREAKAEANEMPDPVIQYPEHMNDPDARAKFAAEVRMRARYDWNEKTAADKKFEVAGHREIAQMVAAAKEFGVEVKSAADLVALKNLVNGNVAQGGDPEVAQHLTAITQATGQETPAKAAAHVNGWLQHVQQNGPQGMRDLVERGFNTHPANLLTQAEQFELASNLHGVSVREALGRLPVEEALGFFPQLQQYLGQVQQQVADPVQAQSDAVVDEFGRSKPDFQELRGAMAQVMRSPSWRDREGESSLQTLERAYARAKRDRARQGAARPKTKMEADIEAQADRHFGARA